MGIFGRRHFARGLFILKTPAITQYRQQYKTKMFVPIFTGSAADQVLKKAEPDPGDPKNTGSRSFLDMPILFIKIKKTFVMA